MKLETEKMDRAAILHIPLSQYAYARSEYGITIRLRAKKGDLTRCALYVADRVSRMVPLPFTEIVMRICGRDELFDYYEAQAELPYNRICYYFKLEKGREWFYYYADRFSRTLPGKVVNGCLTDERSEYYQYPFILRNEILTVPSWFQSAIVYNIFPDSFAGGRRSICPKERAKKLGNGTTSRSKNGGTLRGIMENLDYIQEMGFNCIYLNPIFTAGEYHKYDVVDYYHIDPCFGTDEDFGSLVDAAHEKGMRVVIDGVFNHCSWYFFAFEDVVKNGRDSIYADWFYDLSYPVVRPEDPEATPGYTCFAYERKMPKLNTENKEVQQYFAEVGKYWIEKYQVDGWRLDVANEISRDFWRNFRRQVKAVNPQAVLIGEVWEDAQTWLQGDAFDSTMNYEFRRICGEYLSSETPDGQKAAWEFDKMLLRYPENIVRGQLNLLDSHDVPRFLSMCGGSLGLWKLGCILLMLMPGVPSLFYGDEAEVEGVCENQYRRPMPWEKEGGQQKFLKSLTQIRREYLKGKTTYQPVQEWIKEGTFAFSRRGEQDGIRVVVHPGKSAVRLNESPLEGRLLMTSAPELGNSGEIEAGGYRILLLEASCLRSL